MTAPSEPEILVFDTGPLSHFAKEGWLGMLRLVVGDRTAVIPDVVAAELREGSAVRAHLQTVLDATWIEQRDLASEAEIREFATFASLLVAKGRNRGEAGVLAFAKAHRATAIIDDGPGRKAAQTHGVSCRGTLSLLCDAVRHEHATVSLVSTIADHLLEGEYRLPFQSGGFEKWATDNGLIPPTTGGFSV
jgi:predicted nucleic acid-binding protein